MTENNNENQIQNTHWVDKVIANIRQWKKDHQISHLHVDDMKTPSGRVHTGALRGVLIHDIVASVLKKEEPNLVSTYVFNDMDPMDGLPTYLSKEIYEQHMGKPLYKIPVPELAQSGINFDNASEEEIERFKKVKNFGELYALDFIDAFRKLGCTQEIVWSHEVYESGKMDQTIRHVLNHVEDFRVIYKEVADYDLPPLWYPFQVICPTCNKVGTTLVTDWDGEQVTFECQPNKVEWAKGCGHAGKISPFGGNGKLLWKVDWPAHWQVLGVNIEGAGKDHTSAGGSRDMANAIVEKVFKTTAPFDIPYEWIMIRGAKMSSSKGIGTSAREFVELFPSEVGRFLFVSRNYYQVIDFDPRTMAIPDLFDEYDEGALAYWNHDALKIKQSRSFEISQLGEIPKPYYLPRFRDVAIWMQYPEIDLVQKFAELKGGDLTAQEREELESRKLYAEIWLNRYANEEFLFRPKATVPESAKQLNSDQIAFLCKARDLVTSKDWHSNEVELQTQLFELAKSSIGPKNAFQAIYQAFIGKNHGPRAAWFLLSISKDQLHNRIEELRGTDNFTTSGSMETLTVPEHLSIFPSIREKYPTVKLGFAILKGVHIQKSEEQLEQAKQALLAELAGLTTEQINQYPEVMSYRKMYKEMGIDWHSRRPSPEALLRRIAQGKELYTVNTCVDAYNLAVITNRVSVGAFDLDQVAFPTILDIAKGGEQILLLGDKEPSIIKAGEVSYFDQQGPYNLDFNYRDAQRTMVTENTTNLMINVDGVHDITRAQVEKTLQDTIDLIQKYCGGTVETIGIIE